MCCRSSPLLTPAGTAGYLPALFQRLPLAPGNSKGIQGPRSVPHLTARSGNTGAAGPEPGEANRGVTLQNRKIQSRTVSQIDGGQSGLFGKMMAS